MKTVIIIGAGFAGLSAAAFMAKSGWKVTVIEKNETAGGRARQLKTGGFTFDMGPSWYWMPEVFEHFFNSFGKKVSDFYDLKRLDPSYRVYWEEGYNDIPADYGKLKELFNSIENESGKKLDHFLKEAEIKYKIGIGSLVFKPGLSSREFLDKNVITNIFKLDIFKSVKKHISKFFKHPKIRQLLEFPVLFLGALPSNTPALYTLMNYADIIGGTWYPDKGMFSIVQAMQLIAEENGVEFKFNENVCAINIENGSVKNVVTNNQEYYADAVISGADYYFTETKLLPIEYQTYSNNYWKRKVLAPSCLLYYIGLNKKLRNVSHHSLFFDVPFDKHAEEIYNFPQWPSEPLFYLNVPSVTDPSLAPKGYETLMVLIPVASGLKEDSEELRQIYLNKIMPRLEKHINQSVSDSIVYLKSYSISDFIKDYNSFRGNAYGLANTLNQTAIFKPSCQSKKVKNLFYTGQLTVPGPGVPPCIISGEVVSKLVNRLYKN